MEASDRPLRVLVFGAHPDDAELFAGGLIVRQRRAGNVVKIVSVTDGRSGHHRVPPEELVAIRRAEAVRAGAAVGAEYVTWDFPDGALLPTLDVRCAIIREIRQFSPDLVLTHRPFDYHPDHRAVGTAVQDACYLVTVPHVCPEVPSLARDPVVASMVDLFTRPVRIQPDVVMDVAAEIDQVLSMLACHQSQVFEWLPYHDGVIDSVPPEPVERRKWLRRWIDEFHRTRCRFFAKDLRALGRAPEAVQYLEVYELSEYAAQPDEEMLDCLFPGRLSAGG
ncbi:MAG: hypothetical protein KatS3mg111_2010 [Pirellulaceae bacterium]|nr:MAG: hypothetical protein KatS3mg111_2010 [Pirellulaceae bacterium]